MSEYNLFKPSEELTDKLESATSGKRFIQHDPQRSGDLISASEYLGKHLMRTVYVLSYMKGVYNEKELRIGENGNFTEEFSFSLLDVIPIPKESRQLFSDLYKEFQSYVENNESQLERWGRLTTDELGVLVIDIKRVVRITATKEKAKLVGGIGFKK